MTEYTSLDLQDPVQKKLAAVLQTVTGAVPAETGFCLEHSLRDDLGFGSVTYYNFAELLPETFHIDRVSDKAITQRPTVGDWLNYIQWRLPPAPAARTPGAIDARTEGKHLAQ